MKKKQINWPAFSLFRLKSVLLDNNPQLHHPHLNWFPSGPSRKSPHHRWLPLPAPVTWSPVWTRLTARFYTLWMTTLYRYIKFEYSLVLLANNLFSSRTISFQCIVTSFYWHIKRKTKNEVTKINALKRIAQVKRHCSTHKTDVYFYK